ncbi:hypothetical protein D9M71_419580 [compost metagenome]
MVDGGDLLALELVQPTLALGHVVDECRSLAVEGQHHREVVGKDAAIGGLGTTIAEGDQRDPVGLGLVRQGIGSRRTIGLVDRYRSAIEAVLEALVALDALLRRPLGLTLLPDQLDAIDAAFDVVDVAQVVDHPGPHRNAAGGIGTDSVGG